MQSEPILQWYLTGKQGKLLWWNLTGKQGKLMCALLGSKWEVKRERWYKRDIIHHAVIREKVRTPCPTHR